MARCQLCDTQLINDQCPQLNCRARMGGAAANAGAGMGAPVAALPVIPDNGIGDNAILDDEDLQNVRRVWDARHKAGGAVAEIVTLCGFPTAGKSWTAERMIAELERRSWHVARDPRSPEPDMRGNMIDTMVLGQTTNLLVHAIGRGDGSRPIELIDLPGEFFRKALLNADERASELADIPYSLIAAIALSDKVIFALPADAIVFGTLISAELKAITNSSDRNEAAEEIESRDMDGLLGEREALLAQMKAMQKQGTRQTADYKQAELRFGVISRQLFESQMYLQEAKNRQFTRFMERVLGRAAFLVHRLGRDRLFETPPERWFDGFGSVEARDLPRLNVFCMAALTKADRVLPLCSEKYGGLPYCADWESLPERHDFLARLQAAGWIEPLRALLRDPRMLMARISPTLVAKFDRWMQVTRFEWVSADWQGDGWSTIYDKSHSHAGIVQLVDWLTMRQRRPNPADPVLRQLDRLRAKAEGRVYEGHGAV